MFVPHDWAHALTADFTFFDLASVLGVAVALNADCAPATFLGVALALAGVALGVLALTADVSKDGLAAKDWVLGALASFEADFRAFGSAVGVVFVSAFGVGFGVGAALPLVLGVGGSGACSSSTGARFAFFAEACAPARQEHSKA